VWAPSAGYEMSEVARLVARQRAPEKNGGQVLRGFRHRTLRCRYGLSVRQRGLKISEEVCPCLADEEVADGEVTVAGGQQQGGVAAVVRLVQWRALSQPHHSPGGKESVELKW
jgi:hypothetical protein